MPEHLLQLSYTRGSHRSIPLSSRICWFYSTRATRCYSYFLLRIFLTSSHFLEPAFRKMQLSETNDRHDQASIFHWIKRVQRDLALITNILPLFRAIYAVLVTVVNVSDKSIINPLDYISPTLRCWHAEDLHLLREARLPRACCICSRCCAAALANRNRSYNWADAQWKNCPM